ncbi:hypothetical protein [Moorena sp. SIO3A2]|uniref:hypothetical protein n=1 Tax=Moorena sp. SIO3A2 TaxID=2607841 RepID=UPI0013B67703|nr:hypothetical protein [Moorena sp. SIO3A2]NEQ15922.1 hypothetical protein [Moorena sp. SIO3E2]NER90461.1 hypothetical protein [Moorena sp. SIO3A2]
MNIKRIFGTLVAFVFTVAVVFGLQVGSASAAPDASLSELSQGGTLIADCPCETFKYNKIYHLPKAVKTMTITDTPEREITIVVQNDSSEYSGDLRLSYLQNIKNFHFDANDRKPQDDDFNPKNSEMTVNNTSVSSKSEMSFYFLK